MPWYYVEHELIPHTAASGLPHIVKYTGSNLATLDTTLHKMRAKPLFCDFIITLLMSIPGYPTAAKDFFNRSVKTFRVVARDGPPGLSNMRSWLIRRTDEKVVCGYFRYMHETKQFFWFQLSRAVMDGHEGGPWVTVQPIFGAHALYTQGPSLEAFWPDKFTDEDFAGRHPASPEVANEFGQDAIQYNLGARARFRDFEISKEYVVPEGEETLEVRHRWIQRRAYNWTDFVAGSVQEI